MTLPNYISNLNSQCGEIHILDINSTYQLELLAVLPGNISTTWVP